MHHTKCCILLFYKVLTILTGRDIHQHVFSALESAEGLIQGGLCFYNQFADTERGFTNFFFRR